MSCFVNIPIDLLARLEKETVHNSNFKFEEWTPGDTDRLRYIVFFLEDYEKLSEERNR